MRESSSASGWKPNTSLSIRNSVLARRAHVQPEGLARGVRSLDGGAVDVALERAVGVHQEERDALLGHPASLGSGAVGAAGRGAQSVYRFDSCQA